MDNFKKEFNVDDYIVYPQQGLGRIISVDYIKFKGKDELYYTVYILSNDMVIKFPYFNMENLGIRKVSTLEKAQKILEGLLNDDPGAYESDWKLRQSSNLNLLKRSNIEDMAVIIKMLYYRNKVKELPIAEKKTYDQAFSIFADEISVILNKDREEIIDLINESLDSNYEKIIKAKKSKELDEEDEIVSFEDAVVEEDSEENESVNEEEDEIDLN